ncbi:MAG: hypothetical protein AB1726_09370, partial [Planctomycetota bacterium]
DLAAGPPLAALCVPFLALGLLGPRAMLGGFAAGAALTAFDTWRVATAALKVVTAGPVIGWVAPQVCVAALSALAGFLIRERLGRRRREPPP